MRRWQRVVCTGAVLWMSAVIAMAAPLDCTVEWQRRVAIDAAVAGSVSAVKVTPSQRVTKGAVLGTLDYMPPEQKVDATQADARSDLWSLAATFYQMLTGDVPRVMRPDRLPTELSPVLFKALEQDPSARYESVSAFGEAVRDALSGPVSATTHGLNEGQCPKLNVQLNSVRSCSSR